jgi:hypothetical protein
MNKKPQQKFEWGFLNGCRYHLHGFMLAEDGAKCVCGLTILRQRRGGWDAVWNVAGVGFQSTRRWRRK